ncbi:DUF397 domain-containing protein [Streptosporangium sp. NBC_01755]|uniref:DUF397 domain-containing protein n=1 Tax=unclassified Streptosporangium TaxID=2632669 RepID=UPI002DDAF72C|nr:MULTISPECIES: DUF397 domain-containing protein [unclassified Streptosporangium]WSA24039.1 DUF397 domain-containing protein [Streptosporangium sp. NBC_01810]WSC97889.1 DUF397 domain-containing protein [Streptosporangium sp. NBC_01755]
MIGASEDLSGVTWRKSSRTGNGGADCVEVAIVPADVALAPHKTDADELYLVRDSKNPDGPKPAFNEREWPAFIGGVKDGEFDPTVLRD